MKGIMPEMIRDRRSKIGYSAPMIEWDDSADTQGDEPQTMAGKSVLERPSTEGSGHRKIGSPGVDL